MQVVSNQDEYSLTVRRSHQNIDFAVFRADRDLTIGLTDDGGDVYREITLSPDEARQLREYLNDPETMRILGIQEISGVKCPTCGQMVGSFLNHPL